MNIKYLQVAKEEFHDAIRYYETQQIGLGKSFQEEVKNSILRIKNFPLMYQITKDGIRKCILFKFNYSILYVIDKNSIVVIAMSHQHREPDYWVGRY
jgi:plasmid stabilization system protein ParE